MNWTLSIVKALLRTDILLELLLCQDKNKEKNLYVKKLSAIELEFKDKTVLLVDDSIVRGTTSKEIVQMARVAGAKKVFFASAAPPCSLP